MITGGGSFDGGSTVGMAVGIGVTVGRIGGVTVTIANVGTGVG